MLSGVPGHPGRASRSRATLPLAPTREFAAPILGTVGEVTAEMVKEHPDAYQPGDQAGLSGLQARYDEQLRGTPGAVVNAVGAGRQGRASCSASAPRRGEPLRATLDAAPADAAERLLAGRRPGQRAGRDPALDRRRSWPRRTGPGNDGYNIATYGQYAPGSTFKIVTSLALLRAGLTPGHRGAVHADDRRRRQAVQELRRLPGQRRSAGIPLRTAVANSCNTAFISQARQARRPRPRRRRRVARPRRRPRPRLPGVLRQRRAARRRETEAAADMIGQGKVLASPMAMATVIASVQSGLAGGAAAGRPGRRRRRPTASTPVSTRRRPPRCAAMLRGVVTSGSGSVPARRARPAGDRQDRHRGVRAATARSSPTPG